MPYLSLPFLFLGVAHRDRKCSLRCIAAVMPADVQQPEAFASKIRECDRALAQLH